MFLFFKKSDEKDNAQSNYSQIKFFLFPLTTRLTLPGHAMLSHSLRIIYLYSWFWFLLIFFLLCYPQSLFLRYKVSPRKYVYLFNSNSYRKCIQIFCDSKYNQINLNLCKYYGDWLKVINPGCLISLLYEIVVYSTLHQIWLKSVI